VNHQEEQSDECPRCGAATASGRVCPRCALQEALGGPSAEEGAPLFLKDIPAPGRKIAYIGDYELLTVIAHGGMGVVYKARQANLNRLVALKMLLGGAFTREDFKRRFRPEAETAAKLQHPNMVPIYEVGEHEGQPYYSMEYVKGGDMAKRVAVQPLVPRKAAEYVEPVPKVAFSEFRAGVGPQPEPAWEVIHNLPPKKSLNLVF